MAANDGAGFLVRSGSTPKMPDPAEQPPSQVAILDAEGTGRADDGHAGAVIVSSGKPDKSAQPPAIVRMALANNLALPAYSDEA